MLLENQTNPDLHNRLELLPSLRARFGNLLREDIVSVGLVSVGDSHVVLVSALGHPVINKAIDHSMFRHLLCGRLPFDWQNAVTIAYEWVNALDDFETAHYFQLFSPHALALLERISNNSTYLFEQEESLDRAKNAMQFQLSLAQDMAAEFAPAILKKVEAAVRVEYQSNPSNGMAGEYPENEWQELGAMLYDGSHLLLNVGIEQLQSAVYSEIWGLSQAEKLALWFGHCEELEESLDGHTLDDDFNVLQDTDTFDRLRESICDDLKYAMQRDWEKRLREIENAIRDDE